MKSCRYCTFFPGHLHGHQGFFFRVFCTSLGHVLHFYMCLIAGNLFVHILQMHWKFRIFAGSFTRTAGLFFPGFPHIPETCTAFLHVCDSRQFICAHPADAPEILHFSWVIYTDIRVVFFRVFRTSLGHVLHFYMCVAYLSRTFTHQIICVHPAYTPKVLHLSRTFTRTLGLFFLYVFCTSPGHVLHLYMSETYLFRMFTHQLVVYIPQMLQKFHICQGHLPRHLGCFYWVFHTSLGHVLHLHMLLAYYVSDI